MGRLPENIADRRTPSIFNSVSSGHSSPPSHYELRDVRVIFRGSTNTQASEGRALLLPEEMEMIRTSLLAAGGGEAAGNVGGDNDAGGGNATDATVAVVPEELFRKYTETDSRPPTPAPTLASGPALTNRAAAQEEDDPPATCNPRERTTLVLDLRTRANAAHHQQLVGSESTRRRSLSL